MDSMALAVTREVGTLPVSIGTALAFESVFATNALDGYNCVLLNIRTVVRNFYQAFKSGVGLQIDPEDAATCVIDELQTLVDQFKTATPVVYLSTYQDLTKFLPGCNQMVVTGEKRMLMDALEDDTIRAILKRQVLRVELFDSCKLEFKVKGKALIFTHCVTDLFVRYEFTDLELLESYTATIKPRSEWYTKLTNGKELTRMPFNKFTLCVFGDKSVFIKPQGLLLRRQLLDVAEANNWTTIVSMDKIRSDLAKLPKSDIRDELVSLAMPYL